MVIFVDSSISSCDVKYNLLIGMAGVIPRSWQVEWPLWTSSQMWQMVFADVPVDKRLIQPSVNCFFDCSSEVLVLPPYCAEAVNNWWMTCVVIMAKNKRGGLQKFLNLSLYVLSDSQKCSIKISTLVHLYLWIILLFCIMASFGGHQEVLDGSASLALYLYTMLVTDVHTLTEPFSIWHYHMSFCSLAVLVCSFVLLEGLFSVLLFIFNVLSSQVGYLHLCNTSLRCSFCRRYELEQKVLALCVRVLHSTCHTRAVLC